MTDERLFERLVTHGGPVDVDPGFDDRLYALLQEEMRRPKRSARRVLLLVATLLLALALGGAVLVGSGIVELPVLPVLPDSSAPRLAYDLDGDIYLADWDGQNPVRIADGLPWDLRECDKNFGGPEWSPDGRHLAYRSFSDDVCRGTVYITDAEGHPAASFPGDGWLLSWSPDSTRVVTWVELFQTIGIYGLDGIRQALFPMPRECASGGDIDPVWSSDGTSVVVPYCELPLDGGAPRRLPPNGTSWRWWEYAYTPDGSKVALAPGFGDSLVIAEADGTELRVLDEGEYQNPVWSPTADRVAFLWSSGRLSDQAGNPAPNTYELRVVDVASGTVTSLTSADGLPYPFLLIRFSPDGDRILFARQDETDLGFTSLWSINADGSDTLLLVSGTGSGDWQPVPGR